jgi:hypothetical protein
LNNDDDYDDETSELRSDRTTCGLCPHTSWFHHDAFSFAEIMSRAKTRDLPDAFAGQRLGLCLTHASGFDFVEGKSKSG